MVLHTVYLAALLGNVAIALGIAVFALRRRHMTGAWSFLGWELSAGLWSASSALSMLSQSAERALLWAVPVRLIGVSLTCVFAFVFALEYSGRRTLLRRRRLLLLFLIPAVTQLVIWLSPSTFVDQELVRAGRYWVPGANRFGAWFWVHLTYTYGLLAGCLGLLFAQIFRSFDRYRAQAVILFLGVLPPLLASLLRTLRLAGVSLDLAPIGFSLTGLVWAFALFRFRLLELMPVARDALIERMDDAAIVVDAHDAIIYCNPAAHALFGPTPDRIAEHALSRPSLHAAASAGRVRREIQVELAGDVRSFDVHVSSLRQAGEQVMGRLIVLRDVTERVRLAQELDAYARTVAHDLKNPVGSIAGYTELLAASTTAECTPTAREYLSSIARICDGMTQIIDALLLLARIRQTDQVPTAPLDMAPIVATVRDRLDATLADSQAELVVPDAWPQAVGYAPWVEEVWANYLSNAVKYGGVPPRVTVGATAAGGMVRFWVRDNGPGLTVEDQHRLFREFSRLEPTRARGHGLGLSIVKRIADKLGGTAGVDSAPGQGSTFWFTLPAPPGGPASPDDSSVAR